MLSLLFNQFLLYIAMGLVLFVPGIFFVFAIGMHKKFLPLEFFVLSVGSSIAIVDFLMIFFGKIGVPLTRLSILGMIALFCAICYTIFAYRRKKSAPEGEQKKIANEK